MLKREYISIFKDIDKKNFFLLLMSMMIVYIAFWLLNYFTPEYLDDLVYKFIYEKEKRYILVKNFNDILYSQYTHYLIKNGRTPVHIIVQTFTGLLGKEVFNYVNAFVFVTFNIVLTKFMGKVTPLNFLVVASLIFLLFPDFRYTILWMTGSVNYMWVCLAISLVLLLLPSLETRIFNLKYLWLFFPGILIGWGHEGICFPLALSFIISLFTQRKTVYNTAAFPLILGFVIGAIICTLSPGVLRRVGGENETFDISNRLIRLSALFSQLKIIYILGAYIIFNFIIFHKNFGGWIKGFYNKNSILVWAIILSLPVIIIGNYSYIRVAFGLEFFAFLILLGIIKEYQAFLFIYVKIIVVSISAFFYFILLNTAYNNYKNTKEIIAELHKHESSIITYNPTKIPWYAEKYILTLVINTSLSKTTTITERLSHIYGYDSLIFLPNAAYEAILKDDIEPDFNKRGKYRMDITKISESDLNKKPYRIYSIEAQNTKNIKKSELIYQPINRPGEFQTINIKGQWWLLSTRKKHKEQYPIAIEMK